MALSEEHTIRLSQPEVKGIKDKHTVTLRKTGRGSWVLLSERERSCDGKVYEKDAIVLDDEMLRGICRQYNRKGK